MLPWELMSAGTITSSRWTTKVILHQYDINVRELSAEIPVNQEGGTNRELAARLMDLVGKGML